MFGPVMRGDLEKKIEKGGWMDLHNDRLSIPAVIFPDREWISLYIGGKCCSTHFFGSLLQEEGSKIKGDLRIVHPSFGCCSWILGILLLDVGRLPRQLHSFFSLVFLPFLVLPDSPIFFSLLTRLWLIRWRVRVEEKRESLIMIFYYYYFSFVYSILAMSPGRCRVLLRRL